jgi:hypothetical protein
MVSEIGLLSAITRLRALEKGVHNAGPWSMELCGVRAPAQRLVGSDNVLFSTEFPEMDLRDETFQLTLFCKDEMVLVRPFVAPGYGSFVVEWELGLGELAAVA